MTITLKKKPAGAAVMAASVAEATLTKLQQQIDRVGQLQDDAAEIQARIKADTERLKPLKEETIKLNQMVAEIESDPDLKLEDFGALFRLEAGAVGSSRSIKDLATVRKLLGDDLFMKLASVKLGDLDKYMTPPQLDQVLATDRTLRTVKIIRRVL